MNLQDWREEVCKSRGKKDFLLAFIDEEIRRSTLTPNQKRSEAMKGHWQHIKDCAGIRKISVRQELDRRAFEELKTLERNLRRTINERKRDEKDNG
ncbi:MAG: hypothetical protein WC210_08710 [Candidatus Neomarinimicrobiota bacterium]|jgi:hypothetical protein